MIYRSFLFGIVVCCIFLQASMALGQTRKAEEKQTVSALRQEVRALREKLKTQREKFEQRLQKMENRVEELSATKRKPSERTPAVSQKKKDAETDLDKTLQKLTSEQGGADAGTPSAGSVGSAVQSMNPDISAIVDTFYHQDNAEKNIQDVLNGIPGFGHAHGHGHGHDHGYLEEGFNMRHLELHLSADVDPYFRAWAIAAISEHGAEMEEAVIETTSLPYGLKLKGGKFFSDFGRINPQHSHEWDFVDQPLVYELLLGSHGLNEKGLQLSWLAPTPFQLLFGVEALQGENERMFSTVDAEELSDEEGPRLGVAWMKFGPNLPGPHGLQFGLFGAQGTQQEVHDANNDGTMDHWLDGESRFYGADAVYKYDARGEHGRGDVTLQAEYLRRTKDLSVAQHDLKPAFTGEDRIDRQDGYYVQGVYGFLPRWRAGLRWEQLGLTSESEYPDGSDDSFGSSHRVTGMIDFTPSHFSRLRFQLAHGDYDMGGTDEDVWQFFVQWMISLGTHGAHDF